MIIKDVLRRCHYRLAKVRRRFQDKVVILAYHRIAELVPDPQLLCVSPSHFQEHLEHISECCKPQSLKQLQRDLTSGRLVNRGIVITFDDGYADNLWNAKPLLEKYRIPATVFMTTGFLAHNRELSSDTLERCLLLPRELPDALCLTINGSRYSWKMSGSFISGSDWNVTNKYDPTERHRCYREVHRLLRSLSHPEKERLLDDLSQWASIPTEPRDDRRLLSKEELVKLADGGLIEIGSHGALHLVLEEQPLDCQQKDIIDSKRQLEDILGEAPRSFSYPYGLLSMGADRTVRLVRDAGFTVACALSPVPVTQTSDIFRLPRFLVRNWSGKEFAEKIEEAFAA